MGSPAVPVEPISVTSSCCGSTQNFTAILTRLEEIKRVITEQESPEYKHVSVPTAPAKSILLLPESGYSPPVSIEPTPTMLNRIKCLEANVQDLSNEIAEIRHHLHLPSAPTSIPIEKIILGRLNVLEIRLQELTQKLATR